MGELIDKVKGKAKQVEGRVTGNKAREAEGVADELKGKAKGAFETVKSDIKRAVHENEDDRRQAGPPEERPARP